MSETTKHINRRGFLTRSAIVGCGLAGAGFLASREAAGSAPLPAERGPNIIGPREGFSPQIGILVSMLEWMRRAILEPVHGLTMAELDYLHDAKANTIGTDASSRGKDMSKEDVGGGAT